MDVLRQIDDWPVDVAAVGVTDRDGAMGAHGATGQRLRLASVTKLLTAVGVLVAIQDGLVHLDEPAGPEGSTVRHLLAHASGLPYAEGAPNTTVGKRRIYSNLAFELLGELVVDRADLPFDEHLRVEVFEPLGMNDTSLDGSPAADVTGTVEDLLRFAREILRPSLLDADLVDAATSPQFPALDGVLPGFGRQSPNPWGLGFEIRGAKSPHWTGVRQPAHTCGHFGQAGSFLWIDREAGIACAFLGDRDFDTWAADRWPGFNQDVFDQATGR
jgi:CubicO group peptidase (beta-lactamase class C family)